MQYSQLRPFRIIPDIKIPSELENKKNVCLFVFSENTDFLNIYGRLKIPPKYTKNVFIPTTKKPLNSRLTSNYRKSLVDYKLKPLTEILGGDYSNLIGHNFFFDSSVIMNIGISKWDLGRYDTGRGYKFVEYILGFLNGIPSASFEKTLLYIVDLEKDLPFKLKQRKFYPILKDLYLFNAGKIDIPYDKIILFYCNHENSDYVLLFDKNSIRHDINRIKNVMKVLQKETIKGNVINKINTINNDLQDDSEILKSIPEKDISSIKNMVSNFVTNLKVKNTDIKNKDNLVMNSLYYHLTGNPLKAKSITDKINKKEVTSKTKSDIVQRKMKYIVAKEKTENISRDPIIKLTNIAELTDNINPQHILNLRRREFESYLKNDIEQSFKTLEYETMPLKLKSFNTKLEVTSPSDISKTEYEVFNIILEDNLGKEHPVTIKMPHLTSNGTFLIYGQEKVLITQLITYPIFFLKEYQSRFQSSYSTFAIHSKKLRNISYLTITISNYKIPLGILLGYKLGLKKTLELFNIKNYSFVDKISKEDKTNSSLIKISNDLFLKFSLEGLTEVQQEIINSIIKDSKNFKDIMKDENSFENKDLWREVLIRSIGNRAGIYYIDKTWDNVVTPIEKDILSSRNDPSDIVNIIKYMSIGTVNGKIDDRNDIFKQRVRTSEIFATQLLKQIKAAYSEYQAKRAAGDPNAKYRINSLKIFSEILASKGMPGNVQMFESINPLEELSVLTRVTPIGIGGIMDSDAFPERARNIHYSYYGNIDPLETPDNANIGIQQHLSIGANITNARGMFALQDRDTIKPSAILSTTSCMIPFVNHDEGARITMAVSQAKQAFPLKNTENPAVQTGYESIFSNMLSNNFIKKSPILGKTEEITDEYISIKDKNGIITNIDIKPIILRSGQGKNGLSIFKPTINIGDKVKPGDIIAEGANIKDGTISNGVNLLAAFMPWKGLNFEDGMIVSESAAKRLTSLHQEEYTAILKENEDIALIVKVGDYVKKGDILISYSSTITDVESYNNIRAGVNGKVVSIEIYDNLPEGSEVPELLKPQYNAFKKYFTKINKKYYKGTFKDRNEKMEGLQIRFMVMEELSLVQGDKINNRHYNKGVISRVEKDEDMPLTPWGERIQIVYNPISIINRMNPGQLMEAEVGLISRELGRKMSIISRDKFQNVYAKILSFLDATPLKTYMKSTISNIKNLSDVEYNKIKDKVTKDGFIPLIIPPFKGPSIDNILNALAVLGLKSRYPLKIKIEGEEKITDPVSVGVIYVYKLEHLGEKKIHSRGLGPYVAKIFTPTQGKKKEGGRQIGEMDFYSLLSYNVPHVVDELLGPLSADHKTKQELISDIIRTGSADFREPKTNPVHNLFVQMMRAIHLTAD